MPRRQWDVHEVTRKGGESAGQTDKYYSCKAPDGTTVKARSLRQAMRFEELWRQKEASVGGGAGGGGVAGNSGGGAGGGSGNEGDSGSDSGSGGEATQVNIYVCPFMVLTVMLLLTASGAGVLAKLTHA